MSGVAGGQGLGEWNHWNDKLITWAEYSNSITGNVLNTSLECMDVEKPWS